MAVLSLFGGTIPRPRRSSSPKNTAGTHGTRITNGYIEVLEKNPLLKSHDVRYRTYSGLMVNTSIVAAGVRYYLNLVAKAKWYWIPSEADTDGEFAQRLTSMITIDPQTPWHRIVRRAAMFRFYGFAVQEWNVRRHADGHLTFDDIAPRPQRTIERWDVDRSGQVLGMIQRSPQDNKEIYLDRDQVLYVVDDTLNDSPEGLGIFRHLVGPSLRLKRYEQLEGFGFETDLRGVPLGRAPFTALREMEKQGLIDKKQREALEAPIRKFVKNHIKNPKLGLLLDSMTYQTADEIERPSNAKQWDIELLTGSATSFSENANAIERLNREMARIMGVEQLLLGAGATGSFSTSKDKTHAFYLLIDSALTEIKETVRKDLVDRIWELNAWDENLKPSVDTEAVRYTDVAEISASLRDQANAGAVLHPLDPVIDELRDMLGLPRRPQEILDDYEGGLLPTDPSNPDDPPTDDPRGDTRGLP